MPDPSLMVAQNVPLWVYQHVPSLLFVIGVGACVGSFLNVVVYRLPAGMSVISPPSRCPSCGVRLKFFTENLPIIGWFLVRGKCRTCGTKVSPQYRCTCSQRATRPNGSRGSTSSVNAGPPSVPGRTSTRLIR